MKISNRLALGIGILSCGGFAAAATPTHTLSGHDSHFSVGVHGSAGLAVVSTFSNLISSQDAEDLYDEYYAHKNEDSSSDAIGFYGLNVGHSWADGDNIWSVNVAANGASGKINSNFTVDTSKLELNHISVRETTKIQQQYNLMLEWKHAVSSHTYITTGFGLSALKTKDTISIEDMYPTAENIYADHSETHKMTLWGAGLSLGVEYFVAQNSAIDMSVNFFTYNSKGLPDTANFNTADPSKPEFIQHRKNHVSLSTISIGYNHYF